MSLAAEETLDGQRGERGEGQEPDILIPVRKGDWNEELRFALRSLSHIRHNRVWLVGHKPKWVRERLGNQDGVYFVPREQKASKYRNATEALVEVTNELGSSMSSPFLLWNDDFFCMQPVQGPMPIYHMGALGEVIDWYRRMRHVGAYWRGMGQTYQLLKGLGYGEPLSYELHLPMPIYREPLLEAWERGRHLEVLHIRTLYGNLARLGGTYREDCKVYRGRGKDEGYRSWPWISTNDDMTLTPVYGLLQETFPDPSPYELDE